VFLFFFLAEWTKESGLPLYLFIKLSGGIFFGVLWFLIPKVRRHLWDLFSGPTQHMGRVDRVWTTTKGVPAEAGGGRISIYHISVAGREFYVSRELHDWLSDGDEAVVTYWPRTQYVKRVDKV